MSTDDATELNAEIEAYRQMIREQAETIAALKNRLNAAQIIIHKLNHENDALRAHRPKITTDYGDQYEADNYDYDTSHYVEVRQ